MTQPPDDHLKALWKGQETETMPMSVDAIRTRAEGYLRSTRRRYIAAVTLGVLCGAAFAGHAVWLSHNWVMRLGWGICVLGSGWMIWRARGRWPGGLPSEAISAAALVDFHRAQLIRQKLKLSNLLVTGGPLMLGLLVALAGLAIKAGRANVAQLGPIIGLLAIWAIAFWFIQDRQSRKLQRQLDELDGRGGA